MGSTKLVSTKFGTVIVEDPASRGEVILFWMSAIPLLFLSAIIPLAFFAAAVYNLDMVAWARPGWSGWNIAFMISGLLASSATLGKVRIKIGETDFVIGKK